MNLVGLILDSGLSATYIYMCVCCNHQSVIQAWLSIWYLHYIHTHYSYPYIHTHYSYLILISIPILIHTHTYTNTHPYPYQMNIISMPHHIISFPCQHHIISYPCHIISYHIHTILIKTAAKSLFRFFSMLRNQRQPKAESNKEKAFT